MLLSILKNCVRPFFTMRKYWPWWRNIANYLYCSISLPSHSLRGLKNTRYSLSFPFISWTGGGDQRTRRLVELSGEHWTLRGAELGTKQREEKKKIHLTIGTRNSSIVMYRLRQWWWRFPGSWAPRPNGCTLEPPGCTGCTFSDGSNTAPKGAERFPGDSRHLNSEKLQPVMKRSAVAV